MAVLKQYSISCEDGEEEQMMLGNRLYFTFVRTSSLVAATGFALLSAVSLADIVSRAEPTINLTSDNFTVLAAGRTTVDIIANDSIVGAGSFAITVPDNSDKGGTLEVVGNQIHYTPTAALANGSTDSFSYTVTEEDWRGIDNGDFTVISADLGGVPVTYINPATGGEYVITNTPGFNNSTWDGVQFSAALVGGNIDESSLYRHGVRADLSSDLVGCNTGSDPSIDFSIEWNLTKIAGSAAGFEASVTNGLGGPVDDNALLFVEERNWPSDGSSRTLTLNLDDKSPAGLSDLRIGLWAQDAQSREPGDDNDWTSNSVQMSYTIDTRNCTLKAATATVTLTIGDAISPSSDADNDGVADTDDLDDDNDGIPDVQEMAGVSDKDTDSDGIVDRLDLDSDNDGILDIQESAVPDTQTIDTDSNGRIDGAVGGNGLADIIETAADSGDLTFKVADSDGDSVADFQDLDSDNDGIIDLTEAGASVALDSDTDARLDGPVGVDGVVDSLQTSVDNGGYDFDTDGNVDIAPDTDNDGNADFRDLDSDQDGISDLIEAGGTDAVPAAGGDGVVDDFVDKNADGLDDSVAAVPLQTPDTDGDGTPNFQDTDSDNDGLSDAEEGIADLDNNNVPDYLQSSVEIETGLSGGGCTPGNTQRFDPVLLIIFGLSSLLLFRRRCRFVARENVMSTLTAKRK